MSNSPLSLVIENTTWERSPLSENCVFIKDGTHGTHIRLPNGVPLLSAKNITSSGKVSWDLDDSLISEDDYAKIHSKYELKKNDLLLTVVGTLGRRALVQSGQKFTIQRSVGAIRLKENVLSPYFLFQFVSTDYFQHQLELRSNATAQAGVYLGELAKIKVPVPPLPEQQKIAAILTAVDEVIASTQAQISKLKDLKTGMMQELLTKGIGHTEFKDSPVGRIPKEWKISSLEQVTIAKGLQTGPFGSQLHAHEYVDFGIPVVMPKDMQDQNIVTSTIAKITQEKADELNRHKLQTGDILFSRRGDIGRCVIVKVENQGWICGTGCLKARLNDCLVPEYFIYYLTLTSVVEWLNNNAVGQTMLNLNTSILAELPVILPPLKEQHIIADSMKALINTLDAKESRLQQLNNTKKALMQDLLTGKVRVRVN